MTTPLITRRPPHASQPSLQQEEKEEAAAHSANGLDHDHPVRRWPRWPWRRRRPPLGGRQWLSVQALLVAAMGCGLLLLLLLLGVVVGDGSDGGGSGLIALPSVLQLLASTTSSSSSSLQQSAAAALVVLPRPPAEGSPCYGLARLLYDARVAGAEFCRGLREFDSQGQQQQQQQEEEDRTTASSSSSSSSSSPYALPPALEPLALQCPMPAAISSSSSSSSSWWQRQRQAQAQPRNLTVFGYKGQVDRVSKDIRKHGSWEPGVLSVLLQVASVARRRRPGWRDRDAGDFYFLDIGANLGAHALCLAAAGYRVLAFEPMPANLHAIRRALCVNDDDDGASALAGRVAVLPLALGEREQRCAVVSDPSNRGDGMLRCQEAEPEEEAEEEEEEDKKDREDSSTDSNSSQKGKRETSSSSRSDSGSSKRKASTNSHSSGGSSGGDNWRALATVQAEEVRVTTLDATLRCPFDDDEEKEEGEERHGGGDGGGITMRRRDEEEGDRRDGGGGDGGGIKIRRRLVGIKMDVESHEAFVIRGGRRFLEEGGEAGRVPVIVYENGDMPYHRRRELLDYLVSQGYLYGCVGSVDHIDATTGLPMDPLEVRGELDAEMLMGCWDLYWVDGDLVEEREVPATKGSSRLVRRRFLVD